MLLNGTGHLRLRAGSLGARCDDGASAYHSLRVAVLAVSTDGG